MILLTQNAINLMDDSVDLMLGGIITSIITVAGSTFAVIWNSRNQHKKTDDKLNENFKELKMRQLKIELNQIIDHDYGIESAKKVFRKYIDCGGNSYMIEKYHDYIESKIGGNK